MNFPDAETLKLEDSWAIRDARISLNAKRYENLRRVKLYASTKDSTVSLPPPYFQGLKREGER